MTGELPTTIDRMYKARFTEALLRRVEVKEKLPADERVATEELHRLYI